MRCNFDNIPSKYVDYAHKVLSGDIVVGKSIKLVAQRFLDYLKRDDVYFDTDKADKPVTFIAKLKYTESPWTGKPFILEPWQAFVIYVIFGLIWKKNDLRVCRSAYIQIARKCGKSSLAAALSLYGIVADNEMGAQVYLCSPSNSQTAQDFQYVKNYVETIDRGGIFKIVRSNIGFNPMKSFIKCLSPKAKLGDGFNPSMAIIDEYHAMDNDDIPNVMVSGMGMRRQPMMIYITTAGFNLGGPCKKYHDMCIEILTKQKEDDTIWPFIYEIDEEDDWTNPDVWPKAVPSLPKVVLPDFIEDRVRYAKNSPENEVDVRTKNINQWVSSSSVWITDEKVCAMMVDVPLDVFKDQPVYGSIDLAYTDDLTAYTLMMPPDKYREFHPEAFIFKNFYYLPDDCLKKGKNWLRYKGWKEKGYLNTTPGDTTDYQYILDEVLEHLTYCRYINLSYDQWQAVLMRVKAEQAGVPCSPFSQSLGNFNKVVQTFELAVNKQMVIIDNNPIVRWNFQNVDMYTNSTGLRKPKKPKDKQQKIDSVITMMQALGNWLADGGDGDTTFIS